MSSPGLSLICLGMSVQCSEGPCGEVTDVIIDPTNRHVTHLVIGPASRHHQTRLVPVEAVRTSNDRMVLWWSSTHFAQAPLTETSDHVHLGQPPEPDGEWDVGITRTPAWPDYNAPGVASASMALQLLRRDQAAIPTSYDRVPRGTVEIRRASPVVDPERHVLGHVDGVIVDATYAVTHVVLDRGVLWGHRDITVPIERVTAVVTDCVRVDVGRVGLATFPSARFRRPRAA